MEPQKGIAVLGSTGSIGVNTLNVIASHPDKFAVLALAAHSRVDRLEEQVRRFRPRLAVLFEEKKADLLRTAPLGSGGGSGLRAWTACAVLPRCRALTW